MFIHNYRMLTSGCKLQWYDRCFSNYQTLWRAPAISFFCWDSNTLYKNTTLTILTIQVFYSRPLYENIKFHSISRRSDQHNTPGEKRKNARRRGGRMRGQQQAMVMSWTATDIQLWLDRVWLLRYKRPKWFDHIANEILTERNAAHCVKGLCQVTKLLS